MSIKTEIEWFDPLKKTPIYSRKLIILTNKSHIWFGVYQNNRYWRCDFIKPIVDRNNISRIFKNSIKYWAYLPKLPEFDNDS